MGQQAVSQLRFLVSSFGAAFIASLVLYSSCLPVRKNPAPPKQGNGAEDCPEGEQGCKIESDIPGTGLQELGSEVYQESLESMQQYHDCKRLKIEGSNGEAVKLRIAANTQSEGLASLKEGDEFAVLAWEPRGEEVQHDQEDLRVTQLWYQIKTEVPEQETGWQSAVFSVCIQ